MNFRRLFTAMALLALCVGLASAQVGIGTVGSTSAGPLTCSATAANPPQLRSEGITELVGDIVLTCTGGNVLAAGAAIPTANVTISLNVNVTSRLISAGSGQPSNASEALLLIDEPGSTTQGVAFTGQTTGPAQAIKQCSNAASGAFPGGPCQQFAAVDPATGQVVASSSSTSATAPFNTFIGLVNANQVTFNGIPVLAPSTVGVARVFRITNVRANAAGLGTGGLAGTTPVVAFISISGTTALPITNPQVQVGFSQMGLTTSLRNADGSGGFTVSTLNQCVSTTKNGVGTLRFTEGFASSFKTRVAAPPAATGSSVPTGQNIPGQILNNSESGLVLPGTAYGLADSGTRVKAVFNNIPAGVSLWVSTTNVTFASPGAGLPAVPSTIDPATIGGQALTSFAQLVINDTTPDSAISGIPTVTSTDTFGTAAVAQIPVVNGSATAVWEVTNTNPNAIDNLDFAVFEAYTSNVGANTPAPGTGTVNMSFAPVSTVTTASKTAFIPRFVDNSTASNLFTVAVCQTVLLYPFVTNQGGFDTGIAIANTTTDPFGTKPQAGACTLNFFGAAAPAAAVATGSIASGTVFTTLASTAAAGFQGYMIAVCNFTLAHGFAFISDLGARNLAMGYLAEILPTGTSARTAMPEQLVF